MIIRNTTPTRSRYRMVFSFIVVLLVMILYAPSTWANTQYSTDDELSVTVDDGRVTSLLIGGHEILPIGQTGGFYIRDYTIDSETDLPYDLDSYGNLLDCSTFEGSTAGEPECTYCLEDQSVWNFADNVLGEPDINCLSLTTTVAEIVLPKTPTTETYYIGIYQDINISSYYPLPTSYDLFCFSFDLATACGFRLEDHPEGWDASDLTKTTYGPHQVIARIDWFATETDLNEMEFKPEPLYELGDERRIARTKASVYETTNDATIATPYTHPTDMTSCGFRSYRPRQANFVRVGVLIYGHMPNDGVPNDDHVYFDNFAFYKAPDMIPVKTDVLLEGSATRILKKASDGTNLTTDLKMSADVDVVNTAGRDYLRISGEIENSDFNFGTTLPPRALDLGFSFPVAGENHDLVWWDDIRHSEAINDSPDVLPFRMTGAIDSRPDLKNGYQGYSTELRSLRGESTQVSVYPYSVLDLGTSENRRALSFGDDLNGQSVTVSHFGYRVIDPVNERGEYYIEFRLGALEEGSVWEQDPGAPIDVDVTPFSFIIFRSDDPDGVTTSNFRIATNDYQTDIFPEFFTRPEPPSAEHSTEVDWEYGGAFYKVKFDVNSHPPPTYVLANNTFNNHAEEYGLRYTQERFDGNSENFDGFRERVDACNTIGVCTLLYRQPWHAKFENPSDSDSMNHFDTLEEERSIFDIAPWGPPWPAIYEAQKEFGLTLPGGLDLFSRNIALLGSSEEKEIYHFPVLLADDWYGTLNLMEQERQYLVMADDNIGELTAQGLEGLQLDNVFFGASGANHLHFDPVHLSTFVGPKNGTLTYSINTLEPAIPQLAANVWYIDTMDQQLDDIDENDSSHGDGAAGNTVDLNIDHELISVNANEPFYGGSKHGIMRADTGGFESSVENFFNKSDRSQNFRRTMARDKNMSRLIGEIESAKCMLDKWPSCNFWNDLWSDPDAFKTLVMYEAAWISLAWGFMPSITAMFEEDYDFYDEHIKPIFGDDAIPTHGLALTSIFQKLHQAGWRPRTQVGIDYIFNQNDMDLFVERFGDVGWGGNAIYFTVLNNDDVSLSPPMLARIFASEPHAIKSIEEISTTEEFEAYEICLKDFECQDFPTRCQDVMLLDRHKEFYLNIRNASTLGLMFGIGNIEGIQLVYRPEHFGVCGWTRVQDWEFSEGWSSQHYSMWRMAAEDKIRIGGPWLTLTQEPLSINDKVLYVFKIWRDNIVDNGDGGSEEERSQTGSGGESTESHCSKYERYGPGWQTYNSAGYNGTVDAAAVTDSGACAYYSINTGTGGPLDVLVHYPATTQATTAAQYDVYVVDYLLGPAGEAELGEPLLTTLINQNDSEAYSTAADEQGFITIGTVDVSLAPMEIKTIVVKLSPAQDQESVNPSALLVADAVMVKQAEQSW